MVSRDGRHSVLLFCARIEACTGAMRRRLRPVLPGQRPAARLAIPGLAAHRARVHILQEARTAPACMRPMQGPRPLLLLLLEDMPGRRLACAQTHLLQVYDKTITRQRATQSVSRPSSLSIAMPLSMACSNRTHASSLVNPAARPLGNSAAIYMVTERSYAIITWRSPRIGSVAANRCSQRLLQSAHIDSPIVTRDIAGSCVTSDFFSRNLMTE